MKPELKLEIPSKTFLDYHPGEVVEGVLNVQMGSHEESLCKGIRITFQGKCKVYWVETIGANNYTYTANEKYFEQKNYVLGTGDYDVMIPPGKNVFPFRFILPEGIPSSYFENHGNVKYKIKAELIRGALKSNQKAVLNLNVHSLLDLNNQPLAKEPVEGKKSKSTGMIRSGTVGYSLKLPKRGYLPKEVVSFTATFSNQSHKRVKSVTAYLIQEAAFCTPAKTLKVPIVLHKINGPEVRPNGTEKWSGNLQIPATPPSHLGRGCKIIDVQYFVKIEMHLSGVSINLRDDIPIIIGSVPLQGKSQEAGKPYTNPASSIQGMLPSVPPPPFQHMYPNLVQPMHGEGIHPQDLSMPSPHLGGPSNQMNHTGIINFAPEHNVNYGWTVGDQKTNNQY